MDVLVHLQVELKPIHAKGVAQLVNLLVWDRNTE